MYLSSHILHFLIRLILPPAAVPRHQARVIKLQYCGEGPIQKTLMLVGKVRRIQDLLLSMDLCVSGSHCSYRFVFLQGITYDTGGADIKAGGCMAGMHRDKCGAAAVAGFFQVIHKIKEKLGYMLQDDCCNDIRRITEAHYLS